MSDPPPQYSGPKKTRSSLTRAVCLLRGGHEWRSTDVIVLTHMWLACMDKRCQRCGLWRLADGRLAI